MSYRSHANASQHPSQEKPRPDRPPQPELEAGQAEASNEGATGAREAAVADEPNRLKRIARLLGPGLIAGASDDDPATIGTCASVGAAHGYTMLWTMLVTLPMMSAAQYMTAKIGQVAGTGLTAVMRKHYSRVLLYPVLLGLLIANSINAGADLGAMAASIGLLVPIPASALIIPIASLVVAFQVWGNYRIIERTFKWLALALLAYVGAAVLAKPDLREVLWGTLLPRIHFDRKFLEALVAISGTTFPPYLYFWQSGQEVEEKISLGMTHAQRRGTSETELRYTAMDVNMGMLMSNTVTYFVILASAATLFRAGQHDIGTAEELAAALRPLAGPAASVLLTIGLIGTGLLAVPVLTTSAAYAVSEAFHWRRGLDKSAFQAKYFYAVIVLSTLIGMEINFIGISPVQALYATSVIYGFLAPPLLLIVVLVSSNRNIMGEHVNSRWLTALGWITVAAASAATIGLVISFFTSGKS